MLIYSKRKMNDKDTDQYCGSGILKYILRGTKAGIHNVLYGTS